MKKTIHSLLLALFCLVLANSARGLLHAQPACTSEPEQIPWPVPPAIAAQDGDEETAGPAHVFIGERNTGNIQVWDLFSSMTQSGTLRPGTELPAGVKGIWSLAIPKPDLIIALVTYDDGATERYGILRSEDLGESWEFLKPEAFKDSEFVSLEGARGGAFNGVDFTGNFWRAALLEMTWLKGDGDYGWVWGRKGILRTTDAGKTWSVAYKTMSQNSQRHNENPGVWGLAFKNPTTGVAIIGPMTSCAYYTTENGGETWTQTKSLDGYLPAAFDFIPYPGSDEYRTLSVNPHTADARNAFTQKSTNGGRNWQALHGTSAAAIAPSRTVPMVEWFWPNPQVGFMVHRRGEIRTSTNGGENWSELQGEDAAYPEVIFGPGRDEPLAGYGQRSVLVRDGFGDGYIAQAITFDCTGEIDYSTSWLVGTFTGVPDEGEPLAGFTVFPNPTADRCEMRFSLEQPETANAVVVDSRGNVMRSVNFGLLETGDHVKNINLRDLPSGSYRLVVRAGEKRGVEAVVIEK